MTRLPASPSAVRLARRATDFMVRPRGLRCLLTVAGLLGVAHALMIMPLGVIAGTADFWNCPVGIVPLGELDMIQSLTGYRYLAAAPWMLPLLQVPNLVPPTGTNALWMDSLPLVALAGRLAAEIAGHPVNLLGGFLFACLAVPGIAMSLVFYCAGARGIIAAVVAACFACATPVMLYEWGHMSLCAQFLIIFALALYSACGSRFDTVRGMAWTALLVATMLIHLYLFVMVAGIWCAALAQCAIDRRAAASRLAATAALTCLAVLAAGLLTGIVADTGQGGGAAQFGLRSFGVYSLNLVSVLIPQYSGVFPFMRQAIVGQPYQTFAFPGVGAEIVCWAGLIGLFREGILRRTLRRHACLLALLFCFVLFALSNRVTLGLTTLIEIPLPHSVVQALGTFRASGRFVWPAIYAVTAGASLFLLRQQQRGQSLALLLACCGLQVIDCGPLRQAIAASLHGPGTMYLDRGKALSVIRSATAVSAFPAPNCFLTVPEAQRDPENLLRVIRSGVELGLIASSRNLPLRSVYTSRDLVDCAADARRGELGLVPGEAYFYLSGEAPTPSQLGGMEPSDACVPIGPTLACRVPPGRP
jgi:hypothetical protein